MNADFQQDKTFDEAYEDFYKDACESCLRALQNDHPEEGFHFSVSSGSIFIDFRNKYHTILSDHTWENMLTVVMAFFAGVYYRFDDKEGN